MKRIISTLLLAFCSIITWGEEAPLWLRHQAISPDGKTIAFTYMGDIYSVSAQGGEARQLTFHEAHDYKVVWSPDGKQLAFSSDRYGNFDVFIMPSTGGSAKRLTFHSSDEQPFCFTPDGNEVYFGGVRQDAVQHRQYPSGSQPELYSVKTTGGRVNQVLTIPAEYSEVSEDGSKIYYHDKKGYENEWRKHHTSSVTRDLWVYNTLTKKHTQLTTDDAEDRHPILSDDNSEIYFLSERSGSFNVYKMNANTPSEVKQLTSFEEHPVRFLSTGDGLLCFGYDGEIYTMRKGDSPKKVEISITTQDKNNTDKYISVGSGIGEMVVSPDGKEIAFTSRGEVFVTSVDKSFTKRITTTPENERFLSFSKDGKSIYYSSERDGRWSIFKTEKVRKEEPYFYASTLLKEEPVIRNEKDNYLPVVSPDGKKIAFVEGRRTIKVIDVMTKKETVLMTPKELFHMRDGDKEFTWSPDSKWLLIEWSKTLNNSEVLLVSADGKKKVNLNESGYYDVSPKWVNEGKQMLWFSNKYGLKSYATSGQSQMDVFTMFFDQEAWDEYNLNEDDYKLLKELKEEAEKKKKAGEEGKEKKKKKKEEEEKSLKFEWDDMKDRVARLTIHSSSLGDAVLSKDGQKLYYLARFEGKMNLWSTNLRTKETKQAMALGVGYGSLKWDDKHENLYLLSGGSISKIDPEAGKNDRVKISSEVIFDEKAERKAMFDHVWIRTKNIFYHSNFHGVNWDTMKTTYGKYVDHIGNSYEFTEMLSEMLGELNVSHAGARYYRSISNPDATASLGVLMDYTHKGNGIKIAEVLKTGPLDKYRMNINIGDVILKIDGELVTPAKDYAQYLNRKTGDFTLLEIKDGKTGTMKTVTVKPISLRAENRLLYKRWVKRNQEEVKKATDGKIGYVHIPGMSDGPYRNIFEEMMGKYFETEGVIVDTRFNGGGDLVADLAMFFTGEPFITYETETNLVGGEPTSRWTKPTLAMINEAQYSDGHCFACGYSDLKIGKTVGMPTPGTCSFAGWEGLPDGSRWGVVPISAKDKKGAWMENNQTEPQFMVKNQPSVISAGRDEQLEKAIEEMLKTINGE